jgi:hypothetical protein
MAGAGPVTARDNVAAELAAETLQRFGRLSLRLTGTSMLPAIHPGDVADFIPVADEFPLPGDIALFRRERRLVAHRVLSANDDGVLTQGDALATLDPPVAHADVLGKLSNLNRSGSDVAWRLAPRARDRLGRWLLRRSDLATRLWLRWHSLSRLAA